MGRFQFSILAFLFLVILPACAVNRDQVPGGHSPAEIDEVPMDPAEREAYLRDFPLLDQNAQEAAPKDLRTGTAPFGVLLKLPKQGKITACSASHISPRKVVTNAHCVMGHLSLGPSSFVVIFYNRSGQRTYSAVESFQYVGNKDADDIAILNLPSSVAANWDTVNGQIQSRYNTIGRRPPVTERATVWAFDPFEAHASLASRYRRSGMVFRPKECLASRTIPVVMGVKANGETANVLAQSNARESMHMFLDSCSSALINGNSGSLISMTSESQKMLGVYHWGIGPTPEALRQFMGFDYTGNGNVSGRINGRPSSGEFFGVGFVFENMVLNGIGPF